ncbi:hypothetical protein CRYUN_Cryun13aG0142500 [Craigia yunnanensis]
MFQEYLGSSSTSHNAGIKAPSWAIGSHEFVLPSFYFGSNAFERSGIRKQGGERSDMDEMDISMGYGRPYEKERRRKGKGEGGRGRG